MGADRVLMLKLLGDTSSIDKSLRKTEGRLKGMSRAGLQWGKAFALGLAIEGVEKLGDAIGDAWTGFREGEKASAQLATTWANLGKDGDELAGVIDDISRMTLKLGTDDTEAINAYNQALKTTGGDGKAAMQRLRIAQNLVANGSAPNLQSALKLIDRAGSGSAATVRKFGLTADTAKGRIKQLGEKVKGAADQAAKNDPFKVFFNEFNEGLEGAIGSLASGDLQGALASITGIGTAAAAAWTGVFPAIDKAMTGLMGGEKKNQLGLPTTSSWDEMKSAIGGVFDRASDLVDAIGPKLGEALAAAGEAWDGLQPHLQNALTFIQPLIDIFSKSLEGGLGFVLDAISGTLTTVGELLKGDFSGAFDAVKETVGKLATDIDTFFSGLPGKLGEWAIGIAGEAGKIGEGIFNGIVDWVTGLPEKIAGIIRDAVNAVIRTWNQLDLGIPAGSFQFWGPGNFGIPNPLGGYIAEVNWPAMQLDWAGSGDIVPDLPELAKGGIIRKRPGGMLARIGEGAHDEAVIPLDGRHGMGGNTITINVNVAPTANLAEVGREITRALKAYGQGGGMPSMKSAIGVG